jgi:NAD dependent epimerase/dehydratase family
MVRRLLSESEALMFNLEKSGHASHLTNAEATADAVRQADPDLVMHLAAESHVDRSIGGLAELRLHRQQRERHLSAAAGGAGPLGATPRRAPNKLPLLCYGMAGWDS